MASKTTLALNADEWLRLGLLGIFAITPWCFAWSNITYEAVQFRPGHL